MLMLIIVNFLIFSSSVQMLELDRVKLTSIAV